MKKVKICDGKVIFAVKDGSGYGYTVLKNGVLYRKRGQIGKLQPDEDETLIGVSLYGANADGNVRVKI